MIGRHLRVIWMAMGLLSCLALIVLFLLPTGWQVERSAELDAPPEEVFPWLEDLEHWRRWSPWQEADYEGLVYHYPGAMSGVGAEVRWDSPATGDGVLHIIESRPPYLLAFEMHFQQGRISARDTMVLERLPAGGTLLTWRDRGSLGNTLLGRLSIPLIERSMGSDLETGLARLAAAIAADREAATGPTAEGSPPG